MGVGAGGTGVGVGVGGGEEGLYMTVMLDWPGQLTAEMRLLPATSVIGMVHFPPPSAVVDPAETPLRNMVRISLALPVPDTFNVGVLVADPSSGSEMVGGDWFGSQTWALTLTVCMLASATARGRPETSASIMPTLATWHKRGCRIRSDINPAAALVS